MRLNTATVIALILTIVGALNWGLVGLFEFDLVAALLGTMSIASRIVYILVALSGIWLAISAATSRSHVPERHTTTTTTAGRSSTVAGTQHGVRR